VNPICSKWSLTMPSSATTRRVNSGSGLW
jgi:hypothetical protein